MTSAPRLASIELWGLDHGLSDRAILLVHNDCERITKISDTAQGHNDLLAVTVAGHPDCARYRRIRPITIRLKHGGIGCSSWAIDATTMKTLLTAPGRPPIEFSCPAMTADGGTTTR